MKLELTNETVMKLLLQLDSQEIGWLIKDVIERKNSVELDFYLAKLFAERTKEVREEHPELQHIFKLLAGV